MEKLEKVKINTPKGERELIFKRVDAEALNFLECDNYCPYSKICADISDPRDPTNKNLSFLDCCRSVDLENMVPVEGTLEDNLSDICDVFKNLIEKDKLVPIKRVIDSICKGWCDDYNESHSNCNGKNLTCILKSLFSHGK